MSELLSEEKKPEEKEIEGDIEEKLIEIGEERDEPEKPPAQPVIRKKRGRPKGWKRQDFQPVDLPKVDEVSMLKRELQQLQNKLSAMSHRYRQETVPSVTIENPAFKGRPLPDDLLVEAQMLIDPQYGDKTPKFVEWLRDNRPEEFEERYRNRRTHLRPQAPINKSDYILDEESGRRIKEMARSKGDDGLNVNPRTYGG
jgi:hypothetical protein